MGPRSWERSMNLPIAQLQSFLYSKDRLLQDFNIKVNCRGWIYFGALLIKIVLYETQVLRTQYESANDLKTIFPT
jgi:hypothetical protein